MAPGPQKVAATMKRKQSGYSLVELLVVVAIIGVVSLVTVPNFIAMRRQGALKSSMRNFATDVRSARQHAVTKRVESRLSFGTGTTAREYTLWQRRPGGVWAQVGRPKYLEEGCYVVSQQNFPDRDADGRLDLIFKPDGTAFFDPGVYRGQVVIATEWNLPTKQYTIRIEYSGAAKVM